MSTLKMKIETISLSEIQIPTIFIQKPPRQEKLNAKKIYVQKHGQLEQPLIVHPDNKQLVDGWAGYLALKELGKNTAQVEWGTKKRPQPAPQPKGEITEETKIAVWKAEDGRCEICKRAMNRDMASFSRVDAQKNDWSADNLHLLCVDCQAGRPDLLTHVIIWEKVVKELAPRIDLSEEETAEFLPDILFRHGVLLRNQKWDREYWIPGIGVFCVTKWKEATVTETIKIYKEPRVKSKPQATTRGLPKPWFTTNNINYR